MTTLGNKIYTVEYLASVLKEDISALPKTAKSVIKKAIEDRLMVDPISFGKPLRYSLKGHRRLRVGDYRIVYRVDAVHYKIIIVAIKHRKEVYEAMQ
jgi:mRNA interferase RelE/StbE